MMQTVPSEIGLYPSDQNEDSYWIELDYGPTGGWNPTLRGWVRPEFISTQPMDDWILLLLTKMETWAEAVERFQNTGEKTLLEHHNQRRQSEDDLYFHGGVRGPQEAIVTLTKIYFSAA
jgi:hypothetical protein